MCLATVYILKDGTSNFLMDKILNIEVSNNRVTLKSLLGEIKTIEGNIKTVDLDKSKIVITTDK